jgi:NADH-quinone oxidoreductase subunit M
MSGLLVATIVVPLLAAVALPLISYWIPGAARGVALVTALVVLVLAAVVTAGFVSEPTATEGAFAVTNVAWLTSAGIDIRFSVGLDGLSIWLFSLSALLMLTCVLVSWEAIDHRRVLFYSMLLLLECGCLGVFAARDIVLFYVFFEFTLIPLFFLIGIWGSQQRRYAAVKFFLYTLAGSLLTFLGLLAIVLWHAYYLNDGTLVFSIPVLTAQLQQAVAVGEGMPLGLQFWIFVALFAGFAIKVPLFPLHTWLPLAHVEAPTAGSVFLAGILLKIGTYGFLRFSIPMLPDATALCAPWLLWLSVIGILYGALVALVQADIKRLIAYSSVSHLGFCMLGLFALNRLGTQGAVLQMVNHGISTGALFAVVGMLYERYHTRNISDLGGLASRAPWLAFFMLLFTLSSIGLPGLNGFAGEFLLLTGMFQRAWSGAPAGLGDQFLWIAVLAVFGVVLGAWYMLWLVQRVFFGPLRETTDGGGSHGPIRDLSVREIAALAPLAVFVFWIGIWPDFFLRPIAPSLNQATIAAQRAWEDRSRAPERAPALGSGPEKGRFARAD